jgi:hypothetical protein
LLLRAAQTWVVQAWVGGQGRQIEH